eukprot:1222981-Ditylum_brightwellii.AAC.1
MRQISEGQNDARREIPLMACLIAQARREVREATLLLCNAKRPRPFMASGMVTRRKEWCTNCGTLHTMCRTCLDINKHVERNVLEDAFAVDLECCLGFGEREEEGISASVEAGNETVKGGRVEGVGANGYA